jgi:hypothetical protein
VEFIAALSAFGSRRFLAHGCRISGRFAVDLPPIRLKTSKNKNVQSSLHLSAISFPFNWLRGKCARKATIRENKKGSKRSCETVKALSAAP